ncbi:MULTISPECIES: type II toxin-antitoxin system HipA family toxin [Marisediminitalea]|jgi:serine/threonine-protein kinase HipA|uniref:type II toxin-antitoxin system HipA family toxin n=1 Tax=Marisediminitalea TaxID=2662254 RepID=UPI000C4AA1A3|nr:type II toxin-antitoxin system HipA family toxin [Marisediminitalea aggregata]MBL53465.1 phosphatidylinositol kinase [Alteromonadaceae bacterium]MCP3865953.1 type II toxin-antitoxin system HipA family toxin [Aestuariibacter sp.]MCP4236661.1 type II toxin-antitoxin system HipA family toxin [Aestuariibacter sp.]MCP4529397.1 type II toxin-antitoxin system HipA family toxin [Aestuariibacter sp.]MCP4947135.1 type II toxin-antitoxin system HipA family toxin [Aestuariibacter sp.]|tara:strand:+ start:10042 stop:11250 length:1209 start_codon:yes stop_codon:yes gene_type:complete
MTTDNLAGLPEQIKRITVNVARQQVGLLTHSSHFSFLYSQDAMAVSLTMPNQPDPYNRGALHPVFTQNLPEGYLRRYISEKLRRHAEIDDMYLLALMGTKGIGHLSYDAGIQLPAAKPVAIEDILHWSGREKLFPQLLERYYLNGMASGVQPKVVISRSAILQKDVIVKTFDEEFPLLTVNEYVCMKCAEHCGLNTPKVWLSDDLQHYVVERFDTDELGNKIGIEDFATLMGRTGDQKYQGTYENVLKVVKLNTGSMEQVEEAFKLVAFNCLIGNGDAHLKNFSLQYLPDLTRIELSPVYDVTHTLIYPTIDNDMALKMRKSKAFPSRHELVEFAYTAGISRSAAGKIVDRMAECILVSLSNMEEVSTMDGLRGSIEAHLNNVMKTSGIQPVFRHDKKKKYE